MPHAYADRVAIVDLGTNTTRLLVAEVRDGEVHELDRRTEITRLGEGVDRDGRLGDEAIERVCKVLSGYREAIDEAGATRTVAIATSAVRDASNGDEFRSLLRDRFGIDARTIPGEEEARLTFLGATSRRAPGADPVLVIDIGGGSTELVIGRPGENPDFFVSTQAGSVRQTERHLSSDPPRREELDAVREEVRAILQGAVPAGTRTAVGDGIAVAGTATSLAAIDQELDPYDPDRVDGYRLSLEAGERILAMLAGLPLAGRREVTGLHPERAPTIVAGAAILVEAMRGFGLAEVEVSEADILHGAALSAPRAG
jgi:exopolyphosphatase / guanosine-5'-triphosphate,3'-diphosphate pyrophosphatase